jgi:hypothetical protein
LAQRRHVVAVTRVRQRLSDRRRPPEFVMPTRATLPGTQMTTHAGLMICSRCRLHCVRDPAATRCVSVAGPDCWAFVAALVLSLMYLFRF